MDKISLMSGKHVGKHHHHGKPVSSPLHLIMNSVYALKEIHYHYDIHVL